MMRKICRLLLVLVGTVGVQAAEWLTSRGFHCIEKCEVGVKNEFDWPVLWCPAVDGVSTLHTPASTGQSGRPDAHEGDHEVPVDDRQLWDYCSPSPVASLEGTEDHEYEEAVNLPARVNRTKRQSGSGGFNPGHNPGAANKVPSSLPDVDCEGECSDRAGRYRCEVPGTNPNSFFCSPNTPLVRNQLTSRNKLWCTGPCMKQPGDTFYQCKTLFGYDHCSPASDRSAKGNLCVSRCQPNSESDRNHHYQCNVKGDGDTDGEEEDYYYDEVEEVTPTVKEDCGFWTVEDGKEKTLEYTINNQVCAGPCLDKVGSRVCEYVSWQWEDTQREANLILSLGSCDPDKGWGWGTIGLIIGGILGGILIIGVVAFFVSRSQYNRAATSEH